MNFHLLQARLVALLQARIRNGEITERSLARLIGVSQPHFHNVLKGMRIFSTGMADQILRRLRIDLIQLLSDGEMAAALLPRPLHTSGCHPVPLLDGRIGSEDPYPQRIGPGFYPFAATEVRGFRSPVAAWLAPDPHRAPSFAGPGVVLLDCHEEVRLSFNQKDYFALDLDGTGTISRVQRTDGTWKIRVGEVSDWQPVPHSGRAILDLIKGRVGSIVQFF